MMIPIELLTVILPIVSALATQILNVLYLRRKEKAAAVGNEINNVGQAVGIYRNMADDLRKEMQREREECTARLADMQKQLDMLTGFINSDPELQQRFKAYLAKLN